MAATPAKRRAARASPRSDSAEKAEDAAYLPVLVTECVTVSGGYLKQPVVVTGHRHRDRVYVLLEHCDWVCKLVSGKSRGRTPFRHAQTLRKLHYHAQTFLADVTHSSALAEDPLLEVDEGPPSLFSVGGTKRQRCRPIRQEPTEMVVPAGALVPSGYPAPCSEPLQCLVWARKYTFLAVCIAQEHLGLVLDFLRHELKG